MVRGAWQATVHGLTESQTWLSNWTIATNSTERMAGWSHRCGTCKQQDPLWALSIHGFQYPQQVLDPIPHWFRGVYHISQGQNGEMGAFFPMEQHKAREGHIYVGGRKRRSSHCQGSRENGHQWKSPKDWVRVKCLQAPSFHKELSVEVPGQGPWIRRPGMKALGLAMQMLWRVPTLTPSRHRIQSCSGRAAPLQGPPSKAHIIAVLDPRDHRWDGSLEQTPEKEASLSARAYPEHSLDVIKKQFLNDR